MLYRYRSSVLVPLHPLQSRRQSTGCRGNQLRSCKARTVAAALVAAAPAGATVFQNLDPITINNNGPANPYPSAMHVTGLSGTISDIDVSL